MDIVDCSLSFLESITLECLSKITYSITFSLNVELQAYTMRKTFSLPEMAYLAQ